jgi:peptidoglycan/LPS O-acetylase OafA/YrhL
MYLPETPNPAVTRETSRLYALDVVRFIAAMVVVLFHYTYRGGVTGDYMTVTLPAVGSVFKYGYLGVELFFIVSGFVITQSAGGRTAGQFVAARVVRLYPGYWLAATLTAIVIALADHPRMTVTASEYLVNLSMLQDLVSVEHVDSVYWSLTRELLFYGYVAVALRLALFKHTELLVASWLMVAATIELTDPGWFARFVTNAEYCSYFAAGVIFYQVYRLGWSRFRLALLAFSYGLSLFHSIGAVSSGFDQFGTSVSKLAVGGIITAFYGLFLAIVTGRFQWLRGKPLISLGLLTYPLYLIHQYIGYTLISGLSRHASPAIAVLSVVALMIAVSWFLAIHLERPLQHALRNSLVQTKPVSRAIRAEP